MGRDTEGYEYEPHGPWVPFLKWTMCAGCGLLSFHNPLTEWFLKKGCYADEHPEYRSARRKLVRSN